ncbi:MAG: GntR family transcriptional regulator, partial [Streptococcus xiaochunlingii]
MTTKYQKIFTTLKNQIDQGILKTGDRLPSVRQLASQYVC